MKYRWGIGLLILANAGLAIAFFQVRSSPPSIHSRSSAPDAEIQASSTTDGGLRKSPASNALFSWQSIQSTDLKKLIANLRAVHCPEETIQDLVVAQVNRQYASRIAALKIRPDQLKPWEASPAGLPSISDRRIQMRALQMERNALLKDLLGFVPPGNDPLDSTGHADIDAALKFIPPEKRDVVASIEEAFQNKTDAITSAAHGFGEAEDSVALRRAQKERREALAQALNPAELEDFELRTSSLAKSMKTQLAGFDPTEKEFRDLFHLREQTEQAREKAIDGATGAAVLVPPTDLNQQLRTILGDQRYAQLQVSLDYNYQTLMEAAEKYGVSRETAARGYDVQQAAELAAQKIRSDLSLSPQAQGASLQQLQQTMEQSLESVMGHSAYASYKRHNSAWATRIMQGQRMQMSAF